MSAERDVGLTRRLVVGFDGSDAARAALGYVARRLGPGDVGVVVHAYGEGRDPGGGDRRERARALLDAAGLPPRETGSQWLCELRDAAPARALVDAAQEHGAHEIVVGARGFGRSRAEVGSVAWDVLRLSDLPVVVHPAHASVPLP